MTSAAVPRRLPVDDGRGRAFFYLHLPAFEAWPEELSLASPHFALLVVCDGAAADQASLDRAMRRALRQGAVCICAAGPGSERVELAADLESVAFELTETAGNLPYVMTAGDRNVADAIAFWAEAALPDGAYRESCASWLAVSVGDRAAEAVRLLLRRQLDPSR